MVQYWGGDYYFDTHTLTFYLEGEYRECSIAELAWRMGLYNRSEVMSVAFSVFL